MYQNAITGPQRITRIEFRVAVGARQLPVGAARNYNTLNIHSLERSPRDRNEPPFAVLTLANIQQIGNCNLSVENMFCTQRGWARIDSRVNVLSNGGRGNDQT